MSVVTRPEVAEAPSGTPTPAGFSLWQRVSLTKRLVATVLATVVIAILALGALTFPVLRNAMIDQKRQEVQSAVSRYDFGGEVRGNNGDHGGPSSYYVVYEIDGHVIKTIPASVSGTPDLSDAMAANDDTYAGGPPATYHVHSVDRSQTDWLVSSRVIDNGPLSGASVFVAVPMNDINRTLVGYGLGLLGLGCIVAPLAGLVGAFAVRRSMQPLRDVEQVASAFGNGDTSRRVAGLAPETEVGRLGGSVNQMLDQIEAELAARQASEERMRRFVGDASHELRTPLAAVRGFAELYRMGAVQGADDVAGVMRRIEDEAKRMGGLVEDLLLLARMDQQRPLQLTTVDLSRIARDANQDAHALAPQRTITLQALDGAPPRQTSLIGDEARIRQVVTNLVANAIRHTPDGTPIELQVGDHGGMAVLRVVDHGPGIPPEHQHRVFERFFRTDASRARNSGGGSGLGLAIVAAIVQAHHGDVRVVSTPGGGATFELSIPQTWQGERPTLPAS